MTRKLFILISLAAALTITGCVKETYNMDNFSKKAHLSPTLAISAVRGNISISDIKDIPNDTVVFDQDNFIRIVFKKDSVLDFNISDYSDFDNLAEFHLDEAYSVFGASVNIKDTVTFDPGNDIQIEKLVIKTGSVNYNVRSQSLASAAFKITLPTVLRGGVAVTRDISVPPNSTVTGSVSIDNTNIDLSKDPKKPYNRLPVEYSITATSGSFSLADKMFVKLDIPSPDFDYMKGYFGQETETFDKDTLDLGIDEVLDHISGDFLLSNPSITLNYSNSFAVPIRADLKATGYKGTETVPLGLNPLDMSFPAAPGERDKSAAFTIDRNNSSLPELVSMPPEKIIFTGSAMMNPEGNDGSRNNYLFGDSRFLGNLEIEVPLEFRINNLQFTDTTENFLKMEDSEDSPINTEDFEFLRIDIDAENGFPLGVSVSMMLLDSLTSHNVDTVSAENILAPADVDANGRVTQPKSCSTSIEIDRKFWSSIDVADAIIFSFILNTTDGGAKDVKIYSDYHINFKASLVLKPDIKIDLK